MAVSTLGVVGINRWTTYKRFAMAKPMITPNTETRTNWPAAAPMEKDPVRMAAIAKRYMIKLDASLIRLSPSSIVESLFGTFNPLKTEAAATASGGEIIPPRRKPNASVNPGMR